MADERHYIIRAANFDGATLVPSDAPWLPEPQDQPHQKIRTLNIPALIVGRFTPQVLGRTTRHNSILRVYADQVEAGDGYWNISAGTILSPSGLVQADPTSIQREALTPLTTRLSGALPIELGPTDDLVVFMGSVARVKTIHIIVIDLDEGEIFDWTAGVVVPAAAAAAATVETRTIAAAGALAPWSGTLYVRATAAAPGDTMTLPLLASIAEGDSVTVFRDGGSWFQVDANGAEEINGATFGIRFRADAYAVRFDRTGAGWSATEYADSFLAISAANTVALAAQGGAVTRLVNWTVNTGTLEVLTLPALASMAIDQELEIVLSSTTNAFVGAEVRPAAGESIDYVVGKAVAYARPGDAVRFRVCESTWVSVTNANNLNRSTIVTSDPAPTELWRGLRVYLCDYGANGSFTLPPAPAHGQEILVVRRLATTVNLVAGANTIVAGGSSGAAFALVQNAPLRLVFVRTGATGVWVAAA